MSNSIKNANIYLGEVPHPGEGWLPSRLWQRSTSESGSEKRKVRWQISPLLNAMQVIATFLIDML